VQQAPGGDQIRALQAAESVPPAGSFIHHAFLDASPTGGYSQQLPGRGVGQRLIASRQRLQQGSERRAGLRRSQLSGRGRVVAGPFKKRTGLVEARLAGSPATGRAGRRVCSPQAPSALESHQPAACQSGSSSANRTAGLRSCSTWLLSQLSLSQSKRAPARLTRSKPKARRRLRQAETFSHALGRRPTQQGHVIDQPPRRCSRGRGNQPPR